MDEITELYDQATQLRKLMLSHAVAAGGKSKPYTLAIASGKGGVGKSTIALAFAYILNDLGRRVLLVDADINLGTLDLMAGVAPAARLGDVVKGYCDFHQALVTLRPDLSLLPGSSGDNQYPALTNMQRQKVIAGLSKIKSNCEIIILDLGAGVDTEVVEYAIASDETLVVTTPEPTAVLAAYAFIKIALSRKPNMKFSAIVNMSKSDRDGNEAIEKLQLAADHFLKINIQSLGSIPSDSNVSNAIAQQRPFAEVFPSSLAMRALQKMGKTLLEHVDQPRSGKIEEGS